MHKETPCNLCGRDHYEVLRKSEAACAKPSGYSITAESAPPPLRIVRCLGCGLCYASPRRSDEEILSSYEEMTDEEYAFEEKGRRIAAGIILKRLEGLRKKGRVLDVGCAAGYLLDEAKKRGWECYGVEPSKWCVDRATENFGLNVFRGELKNAAFEVNFFDAIVLNDAIEHLTDPKETLIRARRLLKPDGIICISTPDIASPASRMLKARWWGINEAHLFYFTKRTLYEMLDAAGFTPVKRASHPRAFTVRYWLLRFERYNRAIHSVLKFLAKKACLADKIIMVNTADQIEVYARKSRKLEYLDELEGSHSSHADKKKMKTIAVLPAYNAAKTIERTVRDIPRGIIDEIILVDDKSSDDTVAAAKRLGLKVFEHVINKGYGANQKTCYQKALEMGADIIVMVHPDYQYDPRAIPALIEPIQRGGADAVFGSRMMKGGALEGGMPLWKHNANILLTAVENVVFGTYLTEYHSGFRAYSAKALTAIDFEANSDSFIFDTEIIAQMLAHYFKIEEIPIRTRYFDEASTIKIWSGVVYGAGIFITLIKFFLHKNTFIKFRQFQ